MIINTVFTGSSIWALNDLPAVTVPLPALWVGLSIGTARRSNARQRPKMPIGLEGAPSAASYNLYCTLTPHLLSFSIQTPPAFSHSALFFAS